MSLQDFAQKEGDADGTVAFRCFWRLDYLGPCDLDVILVDPQRMGLEIAVCRCEGQQFAQAQSRKKSVVKATRKLTSSSSVKPLRKVLNSSSVQKDKCGERLLPIVPALRTGVSGKL